ncbi:MAG: AAA family ATPase, partial [Desulfovibrio sp.]
GAAYSLHVDISSPPGTAVDVVLRVHPGVRVERAIADKNVRVASNARVVFPLPSNENDMPLTIGGFSLAVPDEARCWVDAGPVTLQPADATAALGDLRREETRAFAEDLLRSGAPQVVTISGEGGVGKTTFCDACAAHLKDEYGFDIQQFTMGNDSAAYFLDRILRGFIAPRLLDRRGPASEALEVDDERGITLGVLDALGTGLSRKELEEMLANTGVERLSASHVHQMIDCVSALACRTSRPRLIVLRDCHLMPEPLQAALDVLFRRLEDTGWNGVRFLLEHRDRDAPGIEAWEARLGGIANALGSRYARHRVEPLTERELLERVCRNLDTPAPQETAEALQRQTGGNPLFLEHVFRQFIDDGIFIPIQGQEGFHRIDHFALFAERLQRYPRNLHDFLKYRLDAVCRKSPELRSLLMAYLGLAATDLGAITASYRGGLNEDAIAGALGVDAATVQKLRIRFFSEGVMKGSASCPPAVFVHDIMQLAGARYARNAPDFLDAALSYVRRISHGNQVSDDAKTIPHPHEFLVGGRLALMLELFGGHGKAPACSAEDFFSKAIYLAERRGSFIEQRRGLEGMQEVLRRGDARDAVTVGRRMEVFTSLIENELQQGSQHQAERFIEDARQALEDAASEEVKRSNVYDHTRYVLDRQQTVLNMRQADLNKFINSCNMLANSAYDDEKRHFALTRIILFSLHTNHPRLACAAMDVCLSMTDRWANPHALASFLSDVGQLFFIDMPELTELLWEKGLRYAETAQENTNRALQRTKEAQQTGRAASAASRLAGVANNAYRQVMHSRVNVAVIAAMLRSDGVDISELESLRDELADKGITNPLIRLICAIGMVHAFRGEWEKADAVWNQGLALTLSTSSTLFTWTYHNNLAVSALRRGDDERAIGFFTQALGAAQGMIEPSVAAERRLAALLDTIRAKLSACAPPCYDLLGVPPEETVKPRRTGALNRLVHNLEMARLDNAGLAGSSPFALPPHSYAADLLESMQNAPGLVVEINGRAYLLSIE